MALPDNGLFGAIAGSAVQDWWAVPVGSGGEEMDLLHEDGEQPLTTRKTVHVAS